MRDLWRAPRTGLESPVIRRLLRALRLDDLLALLFTGALLVLSTLFSVRFDYTIVRGVTFLVVYYAVMFASGRWLVRHPRLSPGQKRTLLAWVLLILVTFILIIPGRDLMLLEKPKYLLVALVPILLAWWQTPPHVDTLEPNTDKTSSAYQLLRDLGPFLVSQLCYLLLHDVVHHISPVDRDVWLISADRLLLGGDLTRWLEPVVGHWPTEWFSATYSLFLIFPMSMVLWFIARGEREALRHMLQALVLCNYVGYLGYLLVPAIGPMYTLSYDVPLVGGWFYQVKEALDELGRVPRDCFPSLHTSNTLVVLLIVRRYARPLLRIYLPLGASCIAATIYLRYHYTIDVVAGFMLGGGAFWAVPRLMHVWSDRLERWLGPETQTPATRRVGSAGDEFRGV